ncbi:unnamed protein product [Urochloa decumbens]|uniref:Uncharacterized protein n=1 Tax=Urochloa decumbens TaxID=240449 RepID=A0ABC9GLE2_9POAL
MATKAVLRPLIFALAITMLVVLAHGSFQVARTNVFKDCMDVIKKHPPYKNPTPKCIKTVGKNNLVGICIILSQEDEETISVERLVSLGRKYGKQEFSAGTRCGSTYIIPELPGPPLA